MAIRTSQRVVVGRLQRKMDVLAFYLPILSGFELKNQVQIQDVWKATDPFVGANLDIDTVIPSATLYIEPGLRCDGFDIRNTYPLLCRCCRNGLDEINVLSFFKNHFGSLCHFNYLPVSHDIRKRLSL